MASEVKDAKHVKDVQVKEEPMPEQEVFGFNDPRYADLQLRLMIAPQSPSLPLPLPLPVVVDRLIDNDSSSATMSVKNSEGRDCSGHDDGAILHVSSLILGQSSPYFRKILNERRPSAPSLMVVYLTPQGTVMNFQLSRKLFLFPKHFTNIVCVYQFGSVKIDDAEKAAFFIMVRSLYCGQVKAKTTAELMSVFELADRLMVHTCINLCSKMMQELTMTLDLSARILDACKMVEQSDDTKKLVSLASSFLFLHFEWGHSSVWDTAKQDEWKQLSPYVIQTLLASDSLLVCNEEKAFEMLEIWISAYSKNHSDGDGERNRVLLWEEFGQLIRWPSMESFCFPKYLKMFEADHLLRPLIVEALLYRIENPLPNVDESRSSSKMLKKRANHPVPVTFIRMTLPYDHGFAFFSISGSEFDKLRSGECRYSERFWMGSFGLRWMMRRPNSREETYYWDGYYSNGDGYRKAILLTADYFSALTPEEAGGRPCVTLCLWDANSRAYVKMGMSTTGWFSTSPYIRNEIDIFSFRAELQLPVVSHKDYI